MMQPAFPMFNIHLRVSVDLYKCDFSTDNVDIKIQSHSGVIYLIIP